MPRVAVAKHIHGSIKHRILFILLLLLGICSVVSAIFLVLSSLDNRKDTFTITWMSKHQAARTGLTATASTSALVAKPLPKFDPDYINKTSAAKVDGSYRKLCPRGCEKNGNCNFEEGRCGYKCMCWHATVVLSASNLKYAKHAK